MQNDTEHIYKTNKSVLPFILDTKKHISHSFNTKNTPIAVFRYSPMV